jgi:plastocyanin
MRFLRFPRVALIPAALILAALGPSCGGGGGSTPAAPGTPTTTTTTVPPATGTADLVISILGDQGGMSFSPATATLRVGQTVAWRNDDTDLHTATQDGGRFNTGNITRGATSAPIAMSAAGAFPYHCALHPGMVGSLTVNP